MSRRSDTTFVSICFNVCFRAILKPTSLHIGMGVALDAQAAAFVYIYARIPQIAEMTLSFHATDPNTLQLRGRLRVDL